MVRGLRADQGPARIAAAMARAPPGVIATRPGLHRRENPAERGKNLDAESSGPESKRASARPETAARRKLVRMRARVCRDPEHPRPLRPEPSCRPVVRRTPRTHRHRTPRRHHHPHHRHLTRHHHQTDTTNQTAPKSSPPTPHKSTSSATPHSSRTATPHYESCTSRLTEFVHSREAMTRGPRTI